MFFKYVRKLGFCLLVEIKKIVSYFVSNYKSSFAVFDFIAYYDPFVGIKMFFEFRRNNNKTAIIIWKIICNIYKKAHAFCNIDNRNS